MKKSRRDEMILEYREQKSKSRRDEIISKTFDNPLGSGNNYQ
jgi:hypothetical protein